MATQINPGAGVQVAVARAKVPQRARKHILHLGRAALSSNSFVRSSGEKEGSVLPRVVYESDTNPR
jgi:hypothetical protein